jgi:hypothetical protein
MNCEPFAAGAVSVLGRGRKVFAANHFRQSAHTLIRIQSVVKIQEPPVVY